MSPVDPEIGRTFSMNQRVRLGDVRIDGTLRLDALARYAQDIATDESADSGITDETGFWVARRVVVELFDDARLGAMLELNTWCGGSGPRWAERCTRVEHAGRVIAEIRALWVRVDRTTGAPVPIPARFHDVYGPLSRRRVRARLEHPPPSSEARWGPWALRTADFDVMGHVNNAVYWAPVEDALVATVTAAPGRPTVRRAEMEYRAGIDPGDPLQIGTQLGSPSRLWFTVDGDVRASAAFWTD